jgi:hypothetical protein
MLPTQAALCGSSGSAETFRRQGLSGGNNGQPAIVAPPAGGGADEVLAEDGWLGGGPLEAGVLGGGAATDVDVVTGVRAGCEVDGLGRCLVGRCLPGEWLREARALAEAEADGLTLAEEVAPGVNRLAVAAGAAVQATPHIRTLRTEPAIRAPLRIGASCRMPAKPAQ